MLKLALVNPFGSLGGLFVVFLFILRKLFIAVLGKVKNFLNLGFPLGERGFRLGFCFGIFLLLLVNLCRILFLYRADSDVKPLLCNGGEV